MVPAAILVVRDEAADAAALLRRRGRCSKANWMAKRWVNCYTGGSKSSKIEHNATHAKNDATLYILSNYVRSIETNACAYN